MAVPDPLPPFCAVVVAAGEGRRAGQAVPKQFASWRGKPLLRHSVERLLGLGAQPVVVVIASGWENAANEALCGLEGILLAQGGATRQQSVANGLEALGSDAPSRVLVHDAARPEIPRQVVQDLLAALGDHAGAVPVLRLVDTIASVQDDKLAGIVDRESLRRVQTPQAFLLDAIRAAHRQDPSKDASDDAQLLLAQGLSVKLINGDQSLKKITYPSDFQGDVPVLRVGSGFDVHRLAEGRPLYLCGIELQHERGLAGHSDADVALHAVVDALLGALGEGDIGDHFPPSDERWRNAASSQFVIHAARLMTEAGYRLANLDLTIICERPKIKPHRDAMRARLAQLLETGLERVSVKATTSEGLGFTGRAEGIAAQAIACLERI